MSLPERKKRLPHASAALALLLAAAVVTGCQVRPLYSDGPTAADGSSTGTTAELAAIAVKPVQTRYAQEVRNRLIFLLGGGSGQTTAPSYSLELIVTELKDKAAAFGIAPMPVTATRPGAPASTAGSINEDAVSALVNLGYKRVEAFGAVARVSQRLGADAPLDAVIRAGLQELAR